MSLSSHRHEQIPADILWRAFSIAFIKDYLNHRNPDAEKRNICERFIKQIKTAYTLEDKENLIRDLGIAARKAQEAKLKKPSEPAKNSWLSLAITSSWVWIFDRFAKERSLSSNTFHAARICTLKHLLSTDEVNHKAEIEKIRRSLHEKSELLKKYEHKGIDVSQMQEDCNALYHQLLDMHDEVTLQDMVNRKQYPLDAFPVQDKTNFNLHLPSDIPFPNLNRPLKYDLNYNLIHYHQEIKINPKREQYFQAVISETLHELQDQTYSSKMVSDDTYFRPHPYDVTAALLQTATTDKLQLDADKQIAPEEKPEDLEDKDKEKKPEEDKSKKPNPNAFHQPALEKGRKSKKQQEEVISNHP